MARAGRWIVLAAAATALSAMWSAGCMAARPSEARTAAVPLPGGEWFVDSGCTSCHPVSVYGITSIAAVAPDLSTAVEDVPKRFGRSLQDFLQAPTGTMAMVLSGRIRLTDEQRATAVEKLEDAYRRHLRVNGQGLVPSHVTP